jgi:hypothetical protein
MESFQCHLSRRFTDRLSGNGSACISRRHACPLIRRLNQSYEFVKHALGHLLEVLLSFFLFLTELFVDVVNSICDVLEESKVTVFKLLANTKFTFIC